MVWRSFFIQGSWNFKGMQNIGFVYSLYPGLKKVSAEGPEKASEKYLPFFNTHPYMAPTVMGVFLNLEESGQAEMLEKFKQTISSSLAAIGDSFFWATLKPIAALLFLLAVLAGQVWGVLLVLLAYNSIHVWVMATGLARGYASGPSGALEIGKILSVERSSKLSYLVPLLSGMALVSASQWQGIGRGIPASLVVFLGAIVAGKLKVGVFGIFYGVFALTLIWTIIR